jgi:hypothetical protein
VAPRMNEEVKQTFCVIRRLDGRYLKEIKSGTRTDNILDAVRFPSEDLQKLKATVGNALQKISKVSSPKGGDFCILMVDASFSLSPIGLESSEKLLG